jgi:hypothetical protein
MSTISRVSASSGSSVSASASASASTSSSEQTIEMLEQEMTLYTQYANGSGPAATAYKALEYAIETKNVSDAQTAMADLQRDSESANSPSSATANSNSTLDIGGDDDGSTGLTQELIGNTLNVTA